jgi:hypothetical protein
MRSIGSMNAVNKKIKKKFLPAKILYASYILLNARRENACCPLLVRRNTHAALLKGSG